ncbi:hypothetical protein [Aestuariibacter salexigens]|uniref:hypothetical protein n=1 Tax=Aestuariibacter salexigens TaxID=226010 RepID=UPI0004218578|nr:hypothetical protein [Aestuariibacter salexigens]
MTDDVAVRIYLDSVSRDSFESSPDITPFKRLSELMKRSELDYKIIFLPWNRALAEVQSVPNSLIYQLLRTDQRENQYIWIMPATDMEPMLLVGRSGMTSDLLKTEVVDGRFSAACFMGSAQCEQLLAFGFRESNLLRTSRVEPFHLESLLVGERVDFIAAFESSLQQPLADISDLHGQYSSYAILDDSVDYLAAAKGMVKPTIIQRLKLAAVRLGKDSGE